MNVKENVLKFLEEHKDEFVSGEEIAESIGVTRSSVWKAISSFRNEGYDIEAVTRRGYRLKSESNMLTSGGIGSLMKYADPSLLTVYQETDSTNTRIKERPMEQRLSQTSSLMAEAGWDGNSYRLRDQEFICRFFFGLIQILKERFRLLRLHPSLSAKL